MNSLRARARSALRPGQGLVSWLLGFRISPLLAPRLSQVLDTERTSPCLTVAPWSLPSSAPFSAAAVPRHRPKAPRPTPEATPPRWAARGVRLRQAPPELLRAVRWVRQAQRAAQPAQRAARAQRAAAAAPGRAAVAATVRPRRAPVAAWRPPMRPAASCST